MRTCHRVVPGVGNHRPFTQQHRTESISKSIEKRRGGERDREKRETNCVSPYQAKPRHRTQGGEVLSKSSRRAARFPEPKCHPGAAAHGTVTGPCTTGKSRRGGPAAGWRPSAPGAARTRALASRARPEQPTATQDAPPWGEGGGVGPRSIWSELSPAPESYFPFHLALLGVPLLSIPVLKSTHAPLAFTGTE